MLEDDMLLCPNCGGINLHQIKVDVFERGEDEEDVLHTQVGPEKSFKSFVVKNEISGNPSLRRHGMTIKFMCETCDAKPKLHFAQHKGITLVNWDYLE